MNKLQKTLNAFVFLLGTTSSYASITLDAIFPWDAGKRDADPTNIFAKPIEDAVVKEIGVDGAEIMRDTVTESAFHMIFNGRDYYMAPFEYFTKEQEDIVIDESKRHASNHVIARGGRCAVSVFDGNLQLAGHIEININDNNGKWFCGTINAISVVHGQDSVLATISYYYTDRPLAKTVSELGSGLRDMTVLLKLQQNGDKIDITQDDSCLGNPNQLDKIAAAKKKLKACAN